ncbi:chemotaxis protein CheA [Desulfovibrio sp. TomC]|uniref:chemotaxis protein CheA n=1 Tax=Desulfovibrio sp. TomC TaxID=1562888 RepID=UPI0005740EC3|nr:chemotaxis protein CheA [Desulfovibrio sp. TomC]KHK02757.1 Signal transduction histidine kinase CheA [Desulfovibrio sp. TomC]
MSDFDPSIGLYVEETRELLGELERGLLELETSPGDAERLDACFRAMHTIKGGGAMFGFDEISRFTHDVETVLDRVRSGELPMTKELLTLTLEAKDHILSLLEAPRDSAGTELRAASDALLASFAAYLPAGSHAAEAAEAAKTAQHVHLPSETDIYACPSLSGPPGIYWVRLRPAPAMLHTGNDPVRLLAEMDTMGLIRVLRHGPIPGLDEADYDPEAVYGVFDLLVCTPCSSESLRDVFIFVEGDSDVSIHRVYTGTLRSSDLDELLATLIGQDATDSDTVRRHLEAAFAAKAAVIETAKLKAQTQNIQHDPGKPAPARQPAAAAAATLRVDAGRLDSLVSMVGELVILQSRLRQAAKARDLTTVTEVDEDLERLTDNLRDVALGLRMLPIGSVFSQFTRLTRDLAESLGKDVEFVAHGGETELDKTVIDRIKDPLVHLLRNSLDHGLEPPADREAAGKTRRGRITLSAAHSAGNVVITIADDGHGIDPAIVRRKAIERGLIAADAEPTEKELLDCIFMPGFSTAATVSDVSGRGVGMDVVKRNIEALRGTVELDSVLGKGTTVTIRLPLTLAIIDGFNVMVGGDSFIVPLVNLRGFQERFVANAVRTVETLERMGEMVPVVSLRRLFAVPGEQPGYERVVMTETEGEMVGFCVDRVIGRQQAVIKSLDDCYRHLKWISGTTINGDGSISLILDVPQLVRFVRAREESRLHGSEPFRTLPQ